MKRITVVLLGSVMVLSSTLVWAGAASNVSVSGWYSDQAGDNDAQTMVLGGSNVDASAKAGAVSISSEATGNTTSSVYVDYMQTMQYGNNRATTTTMGGNNVKAEANASAMNIESKTE